MKTLKIFLMAVLCTTVVVTAHSQKTKTESFKVAGECGTCKKKIETSARQAGATYAFWDQHTKILKVTYNTGTDVSVIQQRIANAGYDTPLFRATDDSYNKLDKCCQYERQSVNKPADCCADPACKMKDGKCVDMTSCGDKACCKDNADCDKKGCCEKAVSEEKKSSPAQ
jgi:hypothetical protein